MSNSIKYDLLKQNDFNKPDELIPHNEELFEWEERYGYTIPNKSSEFMYYTLEIVLYIFDIYIYKKIIKSKDLNYIYKNQNDIINNQNKKQYFWLIKHLSKKFNSNKFILNIYRQERTNKILINNIILN